MGEAVKLLRQQGAEVKPIKMPPSEAAIAAWGVICAAEAAMAHDATYPARREGYSTVFSGFLDAGRAVSGVDYARATVTRRAHAGDLAEIFEAVDLIIAPITAGMVPTTTDFDALCAEPDGLTKLVSLTCVYDSTGSPVLTIPSGISKDGVPVGFQLVGRSFEEATLCRAGLAYQSAHGWRGNPNL
jgi:amidase